VRARVARGLTTARSRPDSAWRIWLGGALDSGRRAAGPHHPGAGGCLSSPIRGRRPRCRRAAPERGSARGDRTVPLRARALGLFGRSFVEHGVRSLRLTPHSLRRVKAPSQAMPITSGHQDEGGETRSIGRYWQPSVTAIRVFATPSPADSNTRARNTCRCGAVCEPANRVSISRSPSDKGNGAAGACIPEIYRNRTSYFGDTPLAAASTSVGTLCTLVTSFTGRSGIPVSSFRAAVYPSITCWRARLVVRW